MHNPMKKTDIEALLLRGIQGAEMTESQINAERLSEVMAMLAAKTEVRGDCLLWTGYTQPNGYGWINCGNLHIAAHRAALILGGVAIPAGMDVCHRCDVRNCVKPSHLYVGTRRQNMADCSDRKRHNKPKGEDHWRAKLSAADVASLRAQRAAGKTLTSLASSFDVHHSTVLRIARGEYRKEVA